MANKILIFVAKHSHQDGVVSMHRITVRERLLLGKPHHLPSNDVQQLQINEVKEAANECHE